MEGFDTGKLSEGGYRIRFFSVYVKLIEEQNQDHDQGNQHPHDPHLPPTASSLSSPRWVPSRRLRFLYLIIDHTKFDLRAIARQFPSLKQVTFNRGAIDDDILVVATETKSLKHVAFSHSSSLSISKVGLLHVCNAKDLQEIFLGHDGKCTKEHVFIQWVVELPKLKRVILFYSSESAEALLKATFTVQSLRRGNVVDYLSELLRFGSANMVQLERKFAYLDMVAMRTDILIHRQ